MSKLPTISKHVLVVVTGLTRDDKDMENLFGPVTSCGAKMGKIAGVLTRYVYLPPPTFADTRPASAFGGLACPEEPSVDGSR